MRMRMKRNTPFVCLFIDLFTYLFIYLFICFIIFIYLSIYLFVYYWTEMDWTGLLWAIHTLLKQADQIRFDYNYIRLYQVKWNGMISQFSSTQRSSCVSCFEVRQVVTPSFPFPFSSHFPVSYRRKQKTKSYFYSVQLYHHQKPNRI